MKIVRYSLSLQTNSILLLKWEFYIPGNEAVYYILFVRGDLRYEFDKFCDYKII